MLKFNRFIKGNFALLLSIAISACTQTSTPVASFIDRSTSVSSLTPRPSPNPTPTATVTPHPTLSARRPYLMIPQGERVIIEYDAEGVGRKVIELPSDSYLSYHPGLKSLVSPNGEWLAFHSGNINYGDSAENLPVALNILNLNNGKIITIANIVTESYVSRLEQLSEALKDFYPDRYQPVDNQDWVLGSVRSAFTWGIHSLSWSPDSRALAFAAQIDGLSSDVYLFNLDTGSVQRLEDTIQNVNNIHWSPDGRYVVFENSEPGYVYTGSSLYAVQPSDKTISNPKKLYSGTWLHVGHWLSPELLLIADGTDTAGNFNLQALDIRTGQRKPLWTDFFSNYAVDPLNKIIVVNTGEFAKPERYGVYFISLDNGHQKKVLDGLYWDSLFFRGGQQHRFLMQGISETGTNPTLFIDGDIVGLDISGRPSIIASQEFADTTISISPDYLWLLVYNSTHLYLYDENDNLVQEFPIAGVQSVTWRPDSRAIFFSDDKAIYFLSISLSPRASQD